MKRIFFGFVILSLTISLIGCSDDKPTSPITNPGNTSTSTWNASGGYWSSTVDASSTTEFAYFSFTTRDTTTSGVPKVGATSWDLGFRREVVKTNGGASTNNSGDLLATDLGVVDFAAVTVADTAGKTWVADQIEYFFDDWYDYNTNTHQLTANRNVYSMLDAGGHNYVKFRIDSLTGAGMPPDMGTVWLTYYYQPTADNASLPGPTVSTSFAVESGTVYFDFSSGAVVTPATPSNSTEWDLGFSSYNVFQNSGPNGSGAAKGFYAYTELTDPTDIDAFTAQPAAPMFSDIPSSALTDWYNYTGPPLHQLLSKENVYLLKTGGKVYKVMVESYYANVSGVPTSGHYTFIWKEL